MQTETNENHETKLPKTKNELAKICNEPGNGIKNIWPRLKNIVYNSQKVWNIGKKIELADGLGITYLSSIYNTALKSRLGY